jgi:hypothetical protein
MGQKMAVDRLPKEYKSLVISLINEKQLTEEAIVNLINDKAGKPVVTRTSINRFSQRLRRERAETTSTEISLGRIATALERIANTLEKTPDIQD